MPTKRPARRGRPLKPRTADTYTARVGLEIRRRRLKTERSAGDLAEACGVGPQCWYDWELGRVWLPVERLPQIAAALGCQPRDLLPKK